ncbi:MAG: hypothetical protein JNK72_24515 [Myxococcales bacterium]|nr:hypothetical protein [Myxococcales bacterium]
MRVRPRGVWLALLWAPSLAWADPSPLSPAPLPTPAELGRIVASVEAHRQHEAIAPRRAPRLFVELSMQVWRARDFASDTMLLRRDATGAPRVALGLRRGALDGLIEWALLLDVAAPIASGALPEALSAALAASPCEGQRRFALAPARGATLGLSAFARVRVFDRASPFSVGLGLGLSAFGAAVSGAATATCVDRLGVARDTRSAAVDGFALHPSVNVFVETSYRFGARERFDTGLRMAVSDLGTPTAGVGSAQWFVAWHFGP